MEDNIDLNYKWLKNGLLEIRQENNALVCITPRVLEYMEETIINISNENIEAIIKVLTESGIVRVQHPKISLKYHIPDTRVKTCEVTESRMSFIDLTKHGQMELKKRPSYTKSALAILRLTKDFDRINFNVSKLRYIYTNACQNDFIQATSRKTASGRTIVSTTMKGKAFLIKNAFTNKRDYIDYLEKYN